MNAKIFLLTFLVAFSVLGLGAYATTNCPVNTGWCGIGYYDHWYNVTGVNWNYTNAFGANQPTNWALFKFNTSSLGNVGQLNIQGYSNSIQNLGFVPYIVVTNNFGTTVIEVYRYTASGYAWNSISVFFNPTSSNINGVGVIVENASCLYAGTQYLINLGRSIAPCTATYRNQVFNVWTPADKVSCNAQQICTLNQGTTRLPTIGSGSIYAMVNFTTLAPFVVITNRTMTGNYFNLTFNNGLFNQYTVNTTATAYQLNSGTASVTNSFVPSYASNSIFGSFNGFEGYFSINSNAIISEGMSTRTCLVFATCIYNSLNSGSGVQYTQSTAVSQGYFQLKVQTQFPTTYYIIPSFSTAYKITNGGNYFTNNNPFINGSVVNSSLQGWYYDFTNRTLIYGLSWTYKFHTLAYPNYSSMCGGVCVHPINTNITFGAGNVSYYLLKIPHYAQYGNTCQAIYLRAFVNSSNPFTPAIMNEDFGAIPFYVYRCEQNNATMTLLLANKTTLGYTYNSLYIYTSSVSNITRRGDLGQISILQNWNFLNDYGGNVLSGDGNVPYLIQLTAPLSLNTFIASNAHHPYGDSYNSFGYISSFTNIFTPNLTDTFLVSLTPSGSPSLFTKYIGLSSTQGGMWSTNELYTLGNGAGGGHATGAWTTNLLTQNASFEYLYGNVFSLGQTGHISNTQNCQTYCLPNLPVGSFGNVSTSKTGLNYTHNTTTIAFNGLGATKVTLTTGVSIPEYWIFFIEIILVIVFATTFEATADGHIPFVILLIGQWLITLFALNWTLVIIAVVVTLMFVIYEFTPHQKKEIRINKQR